MGPWLIKADHDILKCLPLYFENIIKIKKYNRDLDLKNSLNQKVTKPPLSHRTPLNILNIKDLYLN